MVDHRCRRWRGREVELLRQEGVVHVTYGDPTRGGQGNTTVGILFNIPRLPYACHNSTRNDENPYTDFNYYYITRTKGSTHVGD